MILLQKAYDEKIMQIKAACHGNTQEIVIEILPKNPNLRMRIGFHCAKAEDLDYFAQPH